MLSVSQLLEKKEPLLHSKVSVQGFFLHDGRRAFLLDKESDSADSGILVEHSDLLKALFRTVPAYGGGKYLYKDRAEITGILRVVSGRPTLDRLLSLTINCDGEVIRVI